MFSTCMKTFAFAIGLSLLGSAIALGAEEMSTEEFLERFDAARQRYQSLIMNARFIGRTVVQEENAPPIEWEYDMTWRWRGSRSYARYSLIMPGKVGGQWTVKSVRTYASSPQWTKRLIEDTELSKHRGEIERSSRMMDAPPKHVLSQMFRPFGFLPTIREQPELATVSED